MSKNGCIPYLLSGHYCYRSVVLSHSLPALGFSLIEVLVALVLVSISVLGTLSVQTRIIQQNLHAYSRSQAVSLAYDMAERLRLNTQAAIAGSYQLEMEDDPGAEGTIAAKDLRDWIDTVSMQLPDGDGAIVVDVATRRASITVCWTKNSNNRCSEHYRLKVLL